MGRVEEKFLFVMHFWNVKFDNYSFLNFQVSIPQLHVIYPSIFKSQQKKIFWSFILFI